MQLVKEFAAGNTHLETKRYSEHKRGATLAAPTDIVKKKYLYYSVKKSPVASRIEACKYNHC